jgi:hypothetical protein
LALALAAEAAEELLVAFGCAGHVFFYLGFVETASADFG